MIAIDTETNKVYYAKSGRKMAKFLSVDEDTVYNWIKKDYRIKQSGKHLVYLNCTSLI